MQAHKHEIQLLCFYSNPFPQLKGSFTSPQICIKSLVMPHLLRDSPLHPTPQCYFPHLYPKGYAPSFGLMGFSAFVTSYLLTC